MFTHPVSTYIFRIALQFPTTYHGETKPMQVIGNSNAMRKMHAETGWQMRLKWPIKLSHSILLT